MILYPAIDLRGGRAVRLLEGDFERETTYDADPVARAMDFAAQGAEWLHLVDLDAARGTGDNRDTIRAITEAVSLPVQVGGGVTDLSLLESGVSRVVIGSLLVRDRERAGALAREASGLVAFGLDHRDGELRVGAWTEGSGERLASVLAWPELEAAAALIITDIATDGALTGPPTEQLAEAVRAAPCPVIASGGVASLDDLRQLRPTGVAGVVVGRAIYEKRFTVAQAIEAVQIGRPGRAGSR